MENSDNNTQATISLPTENKGSFWKRYIRTLNPYISIFTLIAFAFSIVYNFILLDIKEIFDGGYKIGLYINALCMSYLSGFIFYFVSFHIPFISRKEKLTIQINVSIINIITSVNSYILDNLTKKYGFSFSSSFPTEDEWETQMKSAPINKDVDWANELLVLIYQIQREIEKISVVNDLFPDVYYLILPIQNTSLMRSYKFLSDIITFGQPEGKYIFYPDLIREFLKKVEPLNKYYDEKIVPTFFPNGKTQKFTLDI